MADLTQQLTNMGALLNIAGVPPSTQPGEHVIASLVPPLSVLNFTEIVQLPVSLDFIAKDVVFTNTNFAAPGFVEDPNITKILPLFNMLTLPPSIDNSGVPGLIGKLKGTLPVAIPSEAAPDISVVWRVEDDNNVVLTEGSDYIAPAGLTNTALDAIFIVAFTEFDGTVPPPVGRNIYADVTLTAGADSWNGPIGPVRVLVPTIPFPKVLAMSLHTNFQGAALIVVPGSSVISSIQQIQDILQPVRNVLNTLTSIAKFAEMLIGINTLSSVLDATNIAFRKNDKIDNLNDIDLITRAWYENDTEAEDELSSLVYVSPPPPREGNRHKVSFCNDRDMDDGEGKFTLATGEALVALIENLHQKNPAVSPASAAIVFDHDPDGWRWDGGSITTFGDEISSLEFL